MNLPVFSATLPIYEKRDEIVRSIRASQVVIVAGETGSGKTTQLPLLCLEAGYGHHGKIGITQPRRIAATSVAAYVASQLHSGLGSFVGYKVRFNDRESSATKIKFMTDGILLRELQTDRFLNAYDVIIIDEVHERSLNIDFLIGYMQRLLPRRPDLRLILSSATIDASLFSAAFNNAPVITVSGRLFPLDILYHSPEPSDEDDVSFVDAAAGTAQELFESSDAGDLLVFMPTERDILETRDLLKGRMGERCLVLPLFGRMPLSEQTAVFGGVDKRKIVIATNIAETSVTVPNIRFVVDPGLARVKRFDPSAGITRLPVEPISQASARQRAGRCGRVQNGMCVRLYPEEDLLSRPEFTPPEIQRANLGQVILSMASLGLGPIEAFPFLESPSLQAMSQGYRSLVELGALDESRNLTATGRRMARFPLDPALSRMIIEAHHRHCVREMLVIASGLCVQDMRVRPPDKKDLADAVHARFCDPLSDFLFYLKLWDVCGFSTNEKMSLNRLKKFCKEQYLSFTRMREWRDVHDQLSEVVEKTGDRAKAGAATYEQIHCSIAAGFISHVGEKKEDGSYHIAKGRSSSIFPGSSLYKKKPDWIVSCELVETSRLYSRICASIDPLWLESLAPHLCKHRYGEPFFDEESGGVKAKETVSLFGLTIVAGRTVGYGRIRPEEAMDIFILEGLAGGRLSSSHKFYIHNKDLCGRIESFRKKIRVGGVFAGDDAVFSFYKARLECVTSVHELNAIIRKRGSDEFLFMKESDVLLDGRDSEPGLFPDSVTIGNAEFPIHYEFDPSSELDGAAVRIPSPELAFLNETVFDWIVPGLYEPRIRFLLDSVPKSMRIPADSVLEMAQSIASSLVYTGEDFLDSVCECAGEFHGLALDPQSLPIHALPPHLMVKVVVEKNQGKAARHGNSEPWKKNADNWTRRDVKAWSFGDLPQKLEMIHTDHGFPIFGYPSLLASESRVDCVVFTSREEQTKNHATGVRRLAELCLEKELAWLERNLTFDRKLLAPFATPDKVGRMTEILCSLVTNHCFAHENFGVWKESAFDGILERARTEFAAQGSELAETLPPVFSEYFELQSILKSKLRTYNSKSYVAIGNDLRNELRGYMNNLLNKALNLNMVMQYHRYLKAFGFKIQRAFSDIGKYILKYENARRYIDKSGALLEKFASYSQKNQELIIDLAMMVEEYKISLFAQQEVKTTFPISQKRLDEKLMGLRKSGVEP